VLQLSPSTYDAARSRTPSRRARRAELIPRLIEIWKANGLRKLLKVRESQMRCRRIRPTLRKQTVDLARLNAGPVIQ
jgi:hypothetical protein